MQLFGPSLRGKLSRVTGGVWLKRETGRPLYALISAVVPSNTPITATTGAAPFFTDESKAVYAQINYKFAGISQSLDGLSTDLGIRYTKDTTTACSITGLTYFSPIPSASD